MQLKSILNRVQKYKSFVYEEVEWAEKGQEPSLRVSLRARAHTRPLCSGCRRAGPGYDTLPAREFEFVPLWGIPVFFVYALRRVNCKRCGVKVEAVPWAAGKHTLTTTYMHFLALWGRRLSWSEVATIFHTSWEKVFDSVDWMVHWGLEHRPLSRIRSLGIDEVLWRRGHQYLTLVYQIDGHGQRLLWVGKDRTMKTLLRFFRSFGKARAGRLRFICSDLWKPYLKVIARKASQALHVLDRFHVVQHMNKALDEVRAQEVRVLKARGRDPVLTHTRWCLLKRPENLTANQEVKLAELLRHNLKAVRTYLLKEDFQFFWDYGSPTWAGKFLDRWCTRALRSRIEPMKKVARMLRKHRPLLLNWFRAKKKISSGVVEGLNNRLKLTLRKAYGFRTFEAIEVALYHNLGELPEPEWTHKFC
ncbi:MAG TPA: ISL3 family transposase [Candidatus Acidoferrum sp.]|nr:ISL3 family transposase [Candidatus Acidoferrum sp.]